MEPTQTPRGHYKAEELIQNGSHEGTMSKQDAIDCLEYLRVKGFSGVIMDSFNGEFFIEIPGHTGEDMHLDQLGGPNV